MGGPSFFVNYRQLPKGYPRTLESPPVPPATPRPAATLALLRPDGGALEILLLKRSPRTRFLPGAYVFPGGRVDDEDASMEMAAFLLQPSPSEAETLLGHAPGGPPALAFWVTALRETFEEAGVLLGGVGSGGGSVQVGGEERVQTLRRSLHGGHRSFPSVLRDLGGGLDGGNLRYIGHWMTPVHERYRYDTRFFGVEVPQDCQGLADGIEMVEALWLTPAEALSRNRAGTLPMVFPTIMTLEKLLPFRSPREALEEMATAEIPCLLPQVEDTGEGVRMVLAEGAGPATTTPTDQPLDPRL